MPGAMRGRDGRTSREAWMAALALPCASRHSDFLSIAGSDARKGWTYIAERREKVRPRSGREAGLGHARERCAGREGRSGLPVHRSLSHFPVLRGTRTSCPSAALALPCASRHSDFLSIAARDARSQPPAMASSSSSTSCIRLSVGPSGLRIFWLVLRLTFTRRLLGESAFLAASSSSILPVW